MKNTLFFVMLCLVTSGVAQNLEKATHKLISDLIREDTVFDAIKQRAVKAMMSRNELNTKDSLQYVNFVKSRPLRLNRRKINSKFKKLLKEDYVTNGNLSKEFSSAMVKRMNESLPEEGEWEKISMFDGFELLEMVNDKDGYHGFSDPVLIQDNKYLIHHVRLGIDIQFVEEYLVFEIDGESYSLKKPIGIYYH